MNTFDKRAAIANDDATNARAVANPLTRREFIAAGIAFAPSLALAAKTSPPFYAQPTVISQPPRDWGAAAPPITYPDPDILIVDKSFEQLNIGHAQIRRLATGFKWAEGPAWSGEGQYVVFSDVQGDTQYRYLWDNGEVTAFRKPSFNSNGNTFDFQGRQVSAQHYLRRVVRWELNGSMTVLADSYQGKALNSPNDLAPHPDGSIWFTDPPYGQSLNEGHPDTAPGPGNPAGVFDNSLGNTGAGLIGSVKRESPPSTYRWDPSGRLDLVVPSEQIPLPNGICFTPDYKSLYLICSGSHDLPSSGIHIADVANGKVANLRLFTDCMVDGVYCSPDGMRVDRAGNLWASSSGPLGYSGVTVWNPSGKLIGRIRLPETAANVCFAGPKRDHLFICASQSVYMVRVAIQGAAPG